MNVNALYASFTNEYARLSSPAIKEGGVSFNHDGSQFDGTGLALGITSRNVELGKVSCGMAWAYVETYLSALTNENMKIGLFKFNCTLASIDITAIVQKKHCSAVLEFARYAGQHSVWDCELNELIETGLSGSNPLKFTPAEVVNINRSLSVGSLSGIMPALAR